MVVLFPHRESKNETEMVRRVLIVWIVQVFSVTVNSCFTMPYLQEWKVINPYHVHVRRKRSAERDHHIKMSLQLYQVECNLILCKFAVLIFFFVFS